jgi:hypothetical protein
MTCGKWIKNKNYKLKINYVWIAYLFLFTISVCFHKLWDLLQKMLYQTQTEVPGIEHKLIANQTAWNQTDYVAAWNQSTGDWHEVFSNINV